MTPEEKKEWDDRVDFARGCLGTDPPAKRCNGDCAIILSADAALRAKDAEIGRLKEEVSFYMMLAIRAVVEGWRETEVQEEINRRTYGEDK